MPDFNNKLTVLLAVRAACVLLAVVWTAMVIGAIAYVPEVVHTGAFWLVFVTAIALWASVWALGYNCLRSATPGGFAS